MNKRRALVTGASGFVGSHLIRELLHQGWSIVAIDIELPAESDENSIKWLPIDLQNSTELTAALSNETHFDAIFHLAAKIPVKRKVCLILQEFRETSLV